MNAALAGDATPDPQKWRDMIYPNNWKSCTGPYSNSFYGGPTEEVVDGCGSTAIGLYMLFKQSGSPDYITALKKLFAYIWTRKEFNGSHKANREIMGLIAQCRRFAGDDWQPCTTK